MVTKTGLTEPFPSLHLYHFQSGGRAMLSKAENTPEREPKLRRAEPAQVGSAH